MIVMKVKIYLVILIARAGRVGRAVQLCVGSWPNIKLTRGVSQICEEGVCRSLVIYLVSFRTGKAVQTEVQHNLWMQGHKAGLQHVHLKCVNSGLVSIWTPYNTDVFSGHYVIASSLPPEQRSLERRTLVPIDKTFNKETCMVTSASL